MGKRIRVQRRGRGSPTFVASTHKRIAPVRYPHLPKAAQEDILEGKIVGILHEPGRGSPIASVRLETSETYYTVIPEGIHEGQSIQIGAKAQVSIGNVLPLSSIPAGTMICNIELSPNDGGKLSRSSGSYATVVAHTPEGTMLKLPSGKTRYVNDLCRATIGVISGAGRLEKPFLKAGAKRYWMRAKGHLYPRTRGVAMIAAVHPYGSGRRGARKVTTVSRRAPPGKKVGLIAARSTGKRKRRRR
ncbi:MAG: 50S ribosomal protein L2 [Candidatus Bathyarchaeota archaeon]|nr:MAG: 50S ribosomal protein L2 [Candidatus Bathyarchaeota archaeon]